MSTAACSWRKYAAVSLFLYDIRLEIVIPYPLVSQLP
jgi:hypothetical protein